MDWKELKDRINKKIVEFMRKHGSNPGVLVLGREEYDIFKDGVSSDHDVEVLDGVYSFWGMKVRMVDKDSRLELLSKKKVDFLKVEEYPFVPYKMKIDVVIPTRLRETFVSFIDNNTDIGVKVVRSYIKTYKSILDDNVDLTRYQISVEGINKDITCAWINYISEIEKAYIIEVRCDVCGRKWFKDREDYYANFIEGSRDLCVGCKIYG
jgi:hypothetical protein